MKIYKCAMDDTATRTTIPGVGFQINRVQIGLLFTIAKRLGLSEPKVSESAAVVDLHIPKDVLQRYLASHADVQDDIDQLIHQAYLVEGLRASGVAAGSSGEDRREEVPVNLYIGALDAECKPLLSALMKTLDEGDGVLVVYKQRRGAPADSVFDGRVQDFTGGPSWAHCAAVPGQDGVGVTAEVRLSTDILAATLNAGRAPTALFSLPGATTVAADTDRFGVGILSRHRIPVTQIRAVVLEPLNMGLNGDLVQHELTTTLLALNSSGVLGAGNRSLRHFTWGVGAASSPKTSTGDLLVSDTIVDFRAHYNPIAQVEAIRSYVTQAIAKTPDVDVKGFMIQCDAIIERAKSAQGSTGPNVYTGATMVLELANLARMACEVSGLPMRSSAKLPEPGALQDYLVKCAMKWPFYSEVTLRGPGGGQVTLYRSDSPSNSIMLDEESKAAYQKHMVNLQSVMRQLCASHHPTIVGEESKKQIKLADESTGSHLAQLREQLEEVLRDPEMAHERSLAEATSKLHEVIDRVQQHTKKIQEIRHQLLSSGSMDPKARLQYENDLQLQITELDSLCVGLSDRIQALQSSRSLVSLDQLLQNVGKLVKSEKEMADRCEKMGRCFVGGALLWNEMQKYADALPEFRRAAGLDVTHSGSKFFMEPDKAIAFVLGGASVEMENQLFALSIDAACTDEVGRVETPAVVTKLAGDPSYIPDHVRRGLDAWAASARMTTDDYIDAITWVRKGQDLSHIPPSAQWHAAEQMCNDGLPGTLTTRAKEARKCFASIGPMNDTQPFVILNPFWLDIGTSLAKEAASSSVDEMAKTAPQSFTWRGKYGEYRSKKVDAERAAEDVACVAVIRAADAVVKYRGEDERGFREACRFFLMGDGTSQNPGFLGIQKRATPLPDVGADVHLVHSRQNSMFKTGYVGRKDDGAIDWDSALYKSSQTVIMTKESPIFIAWTQALGTKQLGPDHLPYHIYRDAYLMAKSKLEEPELSRCVNASMEKGLKVAQLEAARHEPAGSGAGSARLLR